MPTVKTFDFDTPQTSVQQPIQYIGSLPAHAYDAYVRLVVNLTASDGKNHYYYRTIKLDDNNTTATVSRTGTYNLAIVPMFTGAAAGIHATYAFSYRTVQA